jgi:hypothetical protein
MIMGVLQRWRRNCPPWVLVAQLFIGSFFIAAAYYKVMIYVVEGRSIADDFGYWEGNGWPPMWYRWFIHMFFDLPYGHRVLELSVIALQMVGGVLLCINRGVRTAGWALLFVQCNVFLGTFHHRGFNEFVGISLWIAAFFALRPRSGTFAPRTWLFFTAALAGFAALYLYNRYVMGDPWTTSFEWQRLDLQQDVMSSTWLIKRAALGIASLAFASLLWASVWWISCACIPAMFTRWRMHAVAILTVFAILRTVIWANSITSQGVLFVLLYFLWMTYEDSRTTTEYH